VNGPDFSVAVCTHKNARQLGDLLASLAALRLGSGAQWELVLVDNCGSDATARTIAEWTARLPMRAVREPRPGISYARNAAVAAARGQFICWTDDDVVVPPDWLEIYRRAAMKYPDAAVFGGRIEPRLGAQASAWATQGMRRWPLSSVFACRDLGPDERPLAPSADAVPWGANFAVRAAEQQRYCYDPNLVTGQETDVIACILAGGASGWWLPESRVAHMIRPERLTRGYVAFYFHRAGWAVAYLQRRDAGRDHPLAGADGWVGTPGWLLAGLTLCGDAISTATHRTGLTGVSLRHLARANYMRGIVRFRRGLGPPV
jgi:glycosyltransferase involved in cell wall biosynthesis